MRNILLIAIITLIAVSTGLSLEPMKVAYYTTNTGTQSVHAEIKDNSSGLTLYVSESFTRTPNDNGIIIIDLKEHAGANGDLSGLLATSVNTSVTVDIYVGTTLFSQQRLDALLMAQAQNGILDQDGNLAPPENGSGDVGTDKLRWSSAYFDENTVHIGPAEGEANDTEMRLSYDHGTHTGTITVDDEDVIDATSDLITVNKIVSQEIGNDNTAFGKNSLSSVTTGNSNTAIGLNTLNGNTEGSINTAIGINALYNNTTGSNNTASGNGALFENTEGNRNSGFGNDAGLSIVDGNDNVFVGYNAGHNGSQKTDAENSIAIGANTHTTADNQVVIGNSLITETNIAGDLTIAGGLVANPTGANKDFIFGDDDFDFDFGTTGINTKMYFDKSKGAFRAGIVTSSQWNEGSNVGQRSVAFGANTTASGRSSSALGEATRANGDYSTAMGYITTASGVSSTTMGNNTIADANSSVAMGIYNDNTITGELLTVGNGTSIANRSNAFEVYESGDVVVGNDLTVSNLSGTGDRNIGVDATGKLKVVAGGGGGNNGLVYTEVSSNVTIGTNDQVVYILGNHTVTLPATPRTGQLIHFYTEDIGATLDPQSKKFRYIGADYGSSTMSQFGGANQYQLTLYYNGTKWLPIGR